jgi:hypothetical protein
MSKNVNIKKAIGKEGVSVEWFNIARHNKCREMKDVRSYCD